MLIAPIRPSQRPPRDPPLSRPVDTPLLPARPPLDGRHGGDGISAEVTEVRGALHPGQDDMKRREWLLATRDRADTDSRRPLVRAVVAVSGGKCRFGRDEVEDDPECPGTHPSKRCGGVLEL